VQALRVSPARVTNPVSSVILPLAKNGFSVLRYNYTSHVGRSEGKIVCSSLESMRKDIDGALDFVKNALYASRRVAAYSRSHSTPKMADCTVLNLVVATSFQFPTQLHGAS